MFGGTYGFGRMCYVTFGLLSVSAESKSFAFGRPLLTTCTYNPLHLAGMKPAISVCNHHTNHMLSRRGSSPRQRYYNETKHVQVQTLHSLATYDRIANTVQNSKCETDEEADHLPQPLSSGIGFKALGSRSLQHIVNKLRFINISSQQRMSDSDRQTS